MNNKFYIILIMVFIIIGCAHQRIIHQKDKPEQKIHYNEIKNIGNISGYAFYFDEGVMCKQ